MKPFSKWRAHGYAANGDRHELDRSDGTAPFDELSVYLTPKATIHLEVLNDRDMSLVVGDVVLNIHVANGKAELKLIEGKLLKNGVIK